MYRVVIRVKNMRTNTVCRQEYHRFESAFASKLFAETMTKNANVESVYVMNETDGEVIWAR